MDRLRPTMALLLAVIAAAHPGAGNAQDASDNRAEAGQALIAPLNAVFPLAGEAIRKEFTAPLDPQADWSIKGWVRIGAQSAGSQPIVNLIDAAGRPLIEMAVMDDRLVFAADGKQALSTTKVKKGQWLLVSVTNSAEGIVATVGDERPIATQMQLTSAAQAIVFAPRRPSEGVFSGAVANFTVWQGPPAAGTQRNWAEPNEDLLIFESGSPSWPMQVKQAMDPAIPQDPSTLPVSRSDEAPRYTGVKPSPTPPLTPNGDNFWRVGGWRLVATPEVEVAGEAISRPGYNDKSWLTATVPGTVLTTYVDNQVYPDPAYGLNNLLIPERLNKQDYWYRAEFVLPTGKARSNQTLIFEGINYAAEVWVNGERLGSTKGAFARGRFDLPANLRAGERIAVAVRISPPPHPGLPHEESLSAGPGLNGGVMMIDGPTFGASQGWDWIPTVRDRNTGIWQDVMLAQTGPVRLGDPHVRTVLPNADNSFADVTIEVPVINQSDNGVSVQVGVRFGAVDLTQSVNLKPNSQTVVRFAPDRFAKLHIKGPKLWWPNGYGEPTLHDLTLDAQVSGAISDSTTVRFGMREVTYELSLVDSSEELQRVDFAPAKGDGSQLVAVNHEAIRKVDGGWALSSATEVGATPALTAAPPTPLAPHLVLKVNGVPIAVRGGNWGMDDWMKRVSRERMEPYFRLHRDANVNTIRNWMGQNTEEVFFDLADEYGLLVLNDFWISTQDHNAEPGDTALLLDNAEDTLNRYRHHPSIVAWIGRNEGVPPPVLNEGLDRLVRELDGTRAYLPNSRQVNMSGSGPWNYRAPEDYFTKLANGFSTEVGTPSFPTLETFKAMMPEADQWPISDSWAYHDWHQGKAGDVASFMKAMTNRLGAPTSLEDFEKKAQLLNYEAHRAIFEGMNDGLFERNSGRLLWMTHPAWPSTAWQIYSYDYDTQASFFGAKKGMETVHVQLNLPDRSVAVVNSTATMIDQARVTVTHYDLTGRLLQQRNATLDAEPLATTKTNLGLEDQLLAKAGVVLTKLELFDANGTLLSENVYWQGKTAEAYRKLAQMDAVKVALAAESAPAGAETRITVTLSNNSPKPALMAKLSLLDAAGERILPAFWSDNYVTLLPGESRTVTVQIPGNGPKPASIALAGWNVEPTSSGVEE